MATIAQNLAVLQEARTVIAEAIENKGVTLAQGAGFTDFPQAIEDIPTGVDTSNDTVTTTTLAVGITAHNAAGNQITGTMKRPGNVNVSTSSVTLTNSSPTATVTLSNATGSISIQTYGEGFNASLNNNTITIAMENGGKGNIAVFVSENSSYSCTFKLISVVAYPSWANASDDMIVYMVQAHRNGLINLKNYWTVGDVRQVKNLNTTTITSETIDLVLAPGINYKDENNQTKTSVFNILAVQKRVIRLSTFCSLEGTSLCELKLTDARCIESCISSSINNILLKRKILTYATYTGETTYTTTKYSYGGEYIGGLSYFSLTYNSTFPSSNTSSSNPTYGSNSVDNYSGFKIYYKKDLSQLNYMTVDYDEIRRNYYAQVITSMLI